MAATTAWLQHAPTNAFSLQIQSLPEGRGLNAELERISRWIAMDRIYLYHKKQDGIMYSIILYGEFTQRQTALTAARNLPQQIKKHQPYLRTVQAILNDFNQN